METSVRSQISKERRNLSVSQGSYFDVITFLIAFERREGIVFNFYSLDLLGQSYSFDGLYFFSIFLGLCCLLDEVTKARSPNL